MARKNKHEPAEPTDSRPPLRLLARPSRAELLTQLRESFVNAPMGAHPSIATVMRAKGLLNPDGTSSSELREEDVRAVAARDGWKWQREQRLHGRSDLIPAEIQMGAIARAVELRKLLGRLNDMNFRAVSQYHREGRVTTLDGAREIPCPELRSVLLGAMAEQRVTEALMENLQTSQALFIPEPPLSDYEIQSILRLKRMGSEQLREECEQMDKLNELFSRERKTLSMADIEAQNMECKTRPNAANSPKPGKKVPG